MKEERSTSENVEDNFMLQNKEIKKTYTNYSNLKELLLS